jgi:hypothetical protein
MNPRKVQAPTAGTFKYCPITLAHEDPDGFYNTEHVAKGGDAQIFISTKGARMLAEMEGYVSPDKARELHEEISDLRSALDTAVLEISELRRMREQIDGLAASGFKVVNTGGRPSKKTQPDTIREELVGPTAE